MEGTSWGHSCSSLCLPRQLECPVAEPFASPQTGWLAFAGSPAISSPPSQFSLFHLLSGFQTCVYISSLISSFVLLSLLGLCLFQPSAGTVMGHWEGSETNWCVQPAMVTSSRKSLTAVPGRAHQSILQTGRLIYGAFIVDVGHTECESACKLGAFPQGTSWLWP